MLANMYLYLPLLAAESRFLRCRRRVNEMLFLESVGSGEKGV